jgi:hypothetical protein
MNSKNLQHNDSQDIFRAVVKLGLYLAVWICIWFGYQKTGGFLAILIASLITCVLYYCGDRLDQDIENGVSRWVAVPVWLLAALLPAIFSIAGNLNTIFTFVQKENVLLEQIDESRTSIIALGESSSKTLQSQKIADKQARVDQLLSRLQSELTRMNMEGLGKEALKVIGELEVEVGPLQKHLPGGNKSAETYKKLFERYKLDVRSQLLSSKEYVEDRVKDKDALRLAISVQVSDSIKLLDAAAKAISQNETAADQLVKASVENASRLSIKIITEVSAISGVSLSSVNSASKKIGIWIQFLALWLCS